MESDERKVSIIGRLTGYCKRAPILIYTVLFIIMSEILMISAAPYIVPESIYMTLYLSKFARENTFEYIQDNDDYNVRDTLIGWRNRPECAYEKWRTDDKGARSTHDFGPIPKKEHRVMFLGSSLINGGPFVYIDETISALIEDSLTEAVNFGVMRYSLDQVYLYYAEQLHRYRADVIVVELCSMPCDGLKNQYIPFRDRYAADMPYLKPRFMLNGGDLELIPLPPKHYIERIFSSAELIHWLEQTDGFYSDYKIFKRFGLMPISSGLLYVYKKGRNLHRILFGDPEGEMILEMLMQKIVDTAKEHNTSVVFLSLPDLTITDPPGWRRLLPDRYKMRLEKLRLKGFNILDAREIFWDSGNPPGRLFVHDNRHLTPLGNRLVAGELKELLAEYLSFSTATANQNEMPELN